MKATDSRRLRVLQCVTHLGLGGAEVVACRLSKRLSADFDFGFYAVQGIEDNPMGAAMRDGLSAHKIETRCGTRMPLKWGGFPLAALGLLRAAGRFRPDIVHLHTEIPEATYALAAALRSSFGRIPLVRTVHNSVYWHTWPALGRWSDRRMRRSWVACVSNDAKTAFESFRSESGAGPLPAPAAVIYNGVPPVSSQPLRPAPGAGGRVRLLFAGRFEDQKGTDLIPEILRRFRTSAAHAFELVLHGSGTHEPRLRALAAHPPSNWTIRVLPPVADLAAHLREFDLLIVPSRFEGLGLVAVEAAHLGLPVIATDARGLREVLPPGYPWRAIAGDPASFAVALGKAIDEIALWPRVTAEAREFARKRFDEGAMAEAYGQLYRQALAAP